MLTPERARQQAAEAGEIDLRRALSTPGVNGVISPDARDRVKVSDVARYEIGSVFDDGREVVAIDRVEGVLTLAPVGTLAASVLSEHDLGTGRSAVGKAERFGVAAFLPTDAAPAGRLKARVRANMREYARANGWARYPDGADIRSDWGELGRGEYLLTQAEAEMADVESPEVMQADARAIAACRDYEAAAMHAAATEQSAQGALLRRCRVRLDRALAAAEWEARRRG